MDLAFGKLETVISGETGLISVSGRSLHSDGGRRDSGRSTVIRN